MNYQLSAIGPGGLGWRRGARMGVHLLRANDRRLFLAEG